MAELVSEALAAEVKREIRENGLVVWLDAEGDYTALADALKTGALGFSYPVVVYRGSYLELMFALEPYGNGLRPDHLLVHVPGVSIESVKETPLYELAKAGKMFARSLGTVVREAAVGVARPEDLDVFLRDANVTVAKADAWLEGLAASPRDGVSLLLQTLGVENVVLGLLAGDRRLAEHLPNEDDKVLAFLEKGLGLDTTWRRFRLGDAALGAHAAATLIASWLMAVEFVHDLKEAPITPELRALTRLAQPFAQASRKLAATFRERLPDIYEELEGDLQSILTEERTSHHAEVLGSIDTFRFEEVTIRAAALDALRVGNWDRAHAYAKERTPETSFWVRRSPTLERTWELIRLAAAAGRAFVEQEKGLGACASLEEATARYADKLAPVDRAHRVFEQRAHAALTPDLDDHAALLDARAAVRRAYRAWTDAVNRSFFELCKLHGPLPDRSARQRTIYAEIVQRRLDDGARTAFFMVDALRFEMAQGFAEQLRKEKYKVELGARLAELPTDTSVGMNALAPVDDGAALRAVVKNGSIEGFRRKEFAVCQPKDRVRAIGDQSLGKDPVDLELEKLGDVSLDTLKRKLAGQKLVVVRSRDLDTAGENNLHLGTFEQTLVQLKSAVALLSQAGIERFVVSADHGFLLQDATAENAPFGASMRVAERRYAILDAPSGKADVLELRLSQLEYDAPKDLYLVFAPDTAVWKTQKEVPPFVHGGNSLQERVIPVLEIERAAPRGRTLTKYEVVASPEPAHVGRQRLKVAVRLQDRETASLAFEGPKTISLALRVHGKPDLVVTVIAAEPPGELTGGRVLLPPNRAESIVEFEIEGAVDERVRVEIYHPDGTADVTPKIVEGFFDVRQTRRTRKASDVPPPVPAVADVQLVEDEAYRRVFQIIAERRSINEEELGQVLGSPTKVRIFSRNLEKLAGRLSFGVEIISVNGMKVYQRKD